MVEVEHFVDLDAHVGQELGVSGWVEITQPMIDQFGAITGDRHWIHTDPVRARAEAPFGNTVAHGFLTLALLTDLLKDCVAVSAAKRWLNYGLDKVRFTAPVLPGQRVRLRLTLASIEQRPEASARLRYGCTMEVDGSDRPALVADYWTLGYE